MYSRDVAPPAMTPAQASASAESIADEIAATLAAALVPTQHADIAAAFVLATRSKAKK